MPTSSTDGQGPAFSNTRKRAMVLVSERGTSNWLTFLPIEEYAYGFRLHKGGFIDALACRYGWSLSHTRVYCVAMWSHLHRHAKTCINCIGGSPGHGARLDIAVKVFWGGYFGSTYIDVRVFNSYTPTNRNTSMPNC